ncbi:MAG: ThiF family adenylyltransferase [Rhodoferax sp.]
MTDSLNGASRLHFIVGDPIAQVKSPAGVTQAFLARGHNALCVPAHVRPADLAGWLAGVSLAANVDGIIVTVPHKFAASTLCATLSDRAAFLGGVNTLRRNPDGSWHGDMFDGLGYVEAMQARGCQPAGRRAMLVGAGGAGSAIAHALVMAGVAELVIFDPDNIRQTRLVERLAALGRGTVLGGPADPEGFDIALNASPVGMQPSDPLPIDARRLQPHQFVGCVITAPAVPPLIAAARARGCATMTGADMFARVRDRMVDFLLER